MSLAEIEFGRKPFLKGVAALGGIALLESCGFQPPNVNKPRPSRTVQSTDTPTPETSREQRIQQFLNDLPNLKEERETDQRKLSWVTPQEEDSQVDTFALLLAVKPTLTIPDRSLGYVVFTGRWNGAPVVDNRFPYQWPILDVVLSHTTDNIYRTSVDFSALRILPQTFVSLNAQMVTQNPDGEEKRITSINSLQTVLYSPSF